ncbi:MAG: hypothetical protein HY332_00340 [Chloroflexi bacterium]|nr:hypothetical protein [Chloroflexota bacterium]
MDCTHQPILAHSDLEPAYDQAHAVLCEAQDAYEWIALRFATALGCDEATLIALEQALHECVAARERVEGLLTRLPGVSSSTVVGCGIGCGTGTGQMAIGRAGAAITA